MAPPKIAMTASPVRRVVLLEVRTASRSARTLPNPAITDIDTTATTSSDSLSANMSRYDGSCVRIDARRKP